MGSYLDLKLPRPIDGAKTVGELARRGCPKCKRLLYPHASVCFGSLHCAEHGVIWQWMPTARERDGYAPYKWKNRVTGASSPEFRKRYGKGY